MVRQVSEHEREKLKTRSIENGMEEWVYRGYIKHAFRVDQYGSIADV